MEGDWPHSSKPPIGKKVVEKRRRLLASSSSSEEEDAKNEASGEARSQVEKDQTPTEATVDDPKETLYHNPVPESEQATDVEEAEVTEATKSELETIAFEQSEEDEGEVVPGRVTIQGEASRELSKKKTRSGCAVKKPERLGHYFLISTLEQKKPVEEKPEI